MLVPFALWNRTSFLAERVLGNVVSSGIKVMVLAVIVGIGSGFFAEFAAAAAGGRSPTSAQAMSLVLASLALFGLGIFGPGIASGLVAGAPQLGAGAAVGTTAAAVGTVAARRRGPPSAERARRGGRRHGRASRRHVDGIGRGHGLPPRPGDLRLDERQRRPGRRRPGGERRPRDRS